MARHGWGGRPPASDAEARQRIVDATARCIDRHGVTKTTLSDVANELGVTRQTVYRHFDRISDIIGEVAAQGAESFVDRLIAHLQGVGDPAEAVVEGMVFCVRTIPTEPRLSLLLQLGDSSAFSRGATTADTIAYGAKMLQRFPVDWAAAGIGEDDLNGLAEIIMRLLTSLLQHPSRPPQDETRLRALLDRWLAPAFNTAR
ncbi:TetR/AcrR family transcriptional regulator [Actinomadura livida]|uniref:AcrR family transcriptional regulator n=1 Tax=Actinomadura livida TaxID=79909 RepID=A0A7W7MWE2_9ACTN|nr:MULTISPECIES: TetR family transcriptional regulator [Actinomadura]MBB4772717.1 AcrR family transcriptional regulator [Actinomadura catellatispora]GGU12322.1 TetR family transcriptional regulator [Actinomadura livida]